MRAATAESVSDWWRPRRRAQPLDVLVVERVEVDHLEVEPADERVVGVVDEREAAGHAGAEVAARRSEHDDPPAGHVLAAVVADALDDRGRAGVAHAEPLADDAAQERLAAGRAVEDDVAGDDVLLGDEVGVRRRRRAHDEPAARQALAEVVVGVAVEPQRDAASARTRRSYWPAEPVNVIWIVSSGSPSPP